MEVAEREESVGVGVVEDGWLRPGGSCTSASTQYSAIVKLPNKFNCLWYN